MSRDGWTFHATAGHGWPRWCIKATPYGGDWAAAYSFEFVAVECTCLDGVEPWDGNTDRLSFGDCSNFTTDPEAAEPAVKGYLKWDGCIELEWVDGHRCGLRDALHAHVSLIESRQAENEALRR